LFIEFEKKKVGSTVRLASFNAIYVKVPLSGRGWREPFHGAQASVLQQWLQMLNLLLVVVCSSSTVK
jgi:hypothetical protein